MRTSFKGKLSLSSASPNFLSPLSIPLSCSWVHETLPFIDQDERQRPHPKMAALWAVILNPCYLQLNLILPDTRPKTFPINVSTNWVLCTITAKIIPIINHLWFLVLFCLERISQLHSYFGPDNSLLCKVVLYIVGCFSIVFVLYLPDASNNSLVMTIKMTVYTSPGGKTTHF